MTVAEGVSEWREGVEVVDLGVDVEEDLGVVEFAVVLVVDLGVEVAEDLAVGVGVTATLGVTFEGLGLLIGRLRTFGVVFFDEGVDCEGGVFETRAGLSVYFLMGGLGVLGEEGVRRVGVKEAASFLLGDVEMRMILSKAVSSSVFFFANLSEFELVFGEKVAPLTSS